MKSKYLIIGLGSMGKRRARCLMALGIASENIIGTDLREDRRAEARDRYGITVIDKPEDASWEEIAAVIVSLPPDLHFEGVKIAVDHNVPVFVEASVLSEEVRKEMEYSEGRVFVAPSCTFIFHPIVKKIKAMVLSEKYGRVCNFSYHSGQYLPDWHPWEDVHDFYASKRNTGGAREIVPFELTWITDILGLPRQIKGYFRKTIDFGCDIEDTYVSVLDYGDMLGTLTVDVASRYGVRNLIINLEKATLQWRWDKRMMDVYDAETKETIIIGQEEQGHEKGYNANIGEKMYIDEMQAFLNGIKNPSAYPSDLQKDLAVLGLLEELEKSDNSN